MSSLPPRKLDPFAALLSYLVPGLGQIYQGRTAKGLLFLVSLYVLFFYGMWLGSFKNVYLPHTDRRQNTFFNDPPLGDVENRLHFVGQFFIGMAAWPAIVQYSSDPNADQHSFLGTWQRAPKEDELNQLQRNGNKHWDLGWVYTVIAGVLNILVIYDALAGPAVREAAGASAGSREKVPVPA
jgi:uncharacterized protein DUF6677